MSRYIDAEELKHIVNNSKYYGTERQRDFCDMIMETPAADVKPIRHGHWFVDKKFFKDIEVDGKKVCLWHTCSVCNHADQYKIVGAERPSGVHPVFESIRNYCPYCGAKMDKE